MYWIGLAVAYHLNSEYGMAIKILDAFQGSQEQISDAYENSELVLYRNMILEESGEYTEALEYLRSIETQVKDRVTFQEAKGF
jgi:tetratricopeptide (TPR) repeat protein